MPHGGGTRFAEGDDNYRMVLDWIGRRDRARRKPTPRLERIEVFPGRRSSKPKDTLRVVVRAVYSDGTTEDVTRWAKFASSEELVAGVNEDGASPSGHGEAAIIVNFGTRVATLTVTSPYPNAVDPANVRQVADGTTSSTTSS